MASDLPPNRVKQFTATLGTGASLVLAARVSDMFATLAEAGGQDGHAYDYIIEQGSEWEHNSGIWTSATNTLARGTPTQSRVGGTYGTSKINLTGAAVVYFPYFKELFGTVVSAAVCTRKRYYLVANDGATWSKPVDPSFVGVTVFCYGPGGGGGGSGTGGAGYQGGGGGGGAICMKHIAAASLGATETIAVGTGGAAGTTTGNGAAGNKATAFGSQCSAGAGAGGLVGSGTQVTLVAGGTAAGGDVNYNGGYGTGSYMNKEVDTSCMAGGGGACGSHQDGNYANNEEMGGGSGATYACPASYLPRWRGGHGALPPGYDDGDQNGLSGHFPGGGGSGGYRAGSVSKVGGAGANGFMILEEHYG